MFPLNTYQEKLIKWRENNFTDEQMENLRCLHHFNKLYGTLSHMSDVYGYYDDKTGEYTDLIDEVADAKFKAFLEDKIGTCFVHLLFQLSDLDLKSETVLRNALERLLSTNINST
jgi:hypothetical protein